jgi:hypothetical protein
VFGGDLEPATVSDEMMGDSFSIRQQSATATHIRVQPYNAAALSDCRSVLEEVVTWRLVCYQPLVLGVLSIQDWYESEYARWKLLHWNSRLDQ